MLSGCKKYYLIERTVPLGEVRWLNNCESASRIDLTAGEPASELLRIGNRQVTEMIYEYVVHSGGEMLEGLIEYAKAKFGPTFSRGVYIFPVLDFDPPDKGVLKKERGRISGAPERILWHGKWNITIPLS